MYQCGNDILVFFLQLIKLKSNRHEDSRQRIKSAMYLAGLQGKPVVIYVPEDIDQETMLNVSSLMSEGVMQLSRILIL